MEEHLQKDNPWWNGTEEKEYSFSRAATIRELVSSINSEELVHISGTRGVGKTVLLKQVIKYLIEQKHIQSKTILYLNLERVSYIDYSLGDLVKKFISVNKLSVADKVIVVLDEIGVSQSRLDEVEILRRQKDIKLFCSSSFKIDYRLKSNNIKKYQILPLDFYEYLEFNDVVLDRDTMHLVSSYFEEYLRSGGLPGCILNKKLGHDELVDKIISKDIVAKNGLKDSELVTRFFIMLINNAVKDFSINDFAKSLDVSPDTAKRFLGYFEGVYLIDLVEKWSEKSSFRVAKKIYLRDLGIYGLGTRRATFAGLFDNYVYLQLKVAKPKFVKEEGLDLGLLIKDEYLIKPDYGDNEDEFLKKEIMRLPFGQKVIVTDYKGFQEIL